MPQFHGDSGGVLNQGPRSFAPGWPVGDPPSFPWTERVVQTEPVSQAGHEESSFGDFVNFRVGNTLDTANGKDHEAVVSLYPGFPLFCTALPLSFPSVSL